MTLQVELVEPEGEIWSGNAEMVIARTLDGEIGLLTNHAPVIGILYEGSMVQIRHENAGDADIFAAVSGGFLSMADNRVSILARQGSARRGRRRRGGAGGLDRALAGGRARRPAARRSQPTCGTTGALLRAAAVSQPG